MKLLDLNMKNKILVFISIFLFVGITGFVLTRNSDYVYADKYDDQIKALQAQNEAYSLRIKELNTQSTTLANNLAELQTQAAVLQNQINISQVKYDKLTEQIQQTEREIKDSSDALGNTLADMYIDDNISTIELMVSSNNISEFLDRQEFRSSIKENLNTKIATIKKLKLQLETDKKEVEKVLNDQKTQKDELSRRQSDQANLLSKTRGQESAYQSLIGANQAKIAEVRATQALINSRVTSSGGGVLVDSGLLTDYPWNSSNCWMTWYYSNGGSDGNGGDGRGYGCRQCTSYVAWRIAKETGIYYSWGNAVSFTNRAVSAGYKAGPARAGSIAVMDPETAGASQGHVAWVEAVSGDRVLISQYNYNYGAGYGMYSKVWWSINAFDHYVQII